MILLSLTARNKNVTELVIMSLTYTGPDRKKIKLQSSHVSHLLINTNSPKNSIGITHEAAVFVFDSFSFRFVSSTWHVHSISDVFLFMLPRFLSWAMLIFWRLGCRKVSLMESVHSHGHFVSFDLNGFSAGQYWYPQGRGKGVLFYLGSDFKTKHIYLFILKKFVVLKLKSSSFNWLLWI